MINTLYDISEYSKNGKFSFREKDDCSGIFKGNPVDPDGNSPQANKFTYTWDGENRLIKVESGIGTEAQRSKVEFTYDYMGRRVSKKVYSWSSTTNNWQLTTDDRFAYDGWNLIATFSDSPILRLTDSYLWDEDLSGSLQSSVLSLRLLSVNDCLPVGETQQ